ncbi:hypothetical protein XENTR_v10022555 [Xenopus tropicalis]|nr:hypothetical protein XENTR_v10022555 [Xenopus tropicalis]
MKRYAGHFYPRLGKVTVALFILCSMSEGSRSVRFQVSSTPSVSVALGSDVLLPCRMTPEMNAEKMEICWFKTIFEHYVHLYINGKDDYTAQMPQFANRTELLKENITRGIFPLMIRNVTAQDSGIYDCFVESTKHHNSAAVELLVNAVGSLPVISTIADDTVFCESHGWYPEPYLIWTDNEGNKVIPAMENTFRDENNLYHIISDIPKPTTSKITCTVSNSLNQSKQSSRQIRDFPPLKLGASYIPERLIWRKIRYWIPRNKSYVYYFNLHHFFMLLFGFCYGIFHPLQDL